MQADHCDFCGGNSLSFAYQPDGSTRGLKVHVCHHCGLVQSTPRIDRTEKRHDAAVSGGADWGNVRYGKGFRTQAAMDALARHIRFNDKLALLDVGSNRGRFAAAFLEAAPRAEVTAVEPDERYADASANLPRTKLVRSRIEDARLADESFDVVHSCHTIEHLAHPFASLKDHARVLKPGGLLVLDAPNIALIGGDDILEEWFIDKHLYHFSETTLTRMIEAAGFTILDRPDPRDSINLLIVAQKTGNATTSIGVDPMEVARADNLIASYVRNRAINCAALTNAAQELQDLKRQRVALWGAGRLFDSLVRTGGYDPSDLALLIDAHLINHMDSRHGVRLSPPHALSGALVDVVVVMSRGFAEEIVAEAWRLAPDARIILYADLLARARLSRAA